MHLEYNSLQIFEPTHNEKEEFGIQATKRIRPVSNSEFINFYSIFFDFRKWKLLSSFVDWIEVLEEYIAEIKAMYNRK